MRTFGAIILASTLFASSAFAATNAATPLAPGKPAGVQHAQMQTDNTLLLIAGLGVVAGGVALLASGNNSQVTNTTISTVGTN